MTNIDILKKKNPDDQGHSGNIVPITFFFFLISNIKILLKTHSPVHRKCTKRQKHQETKLQ